MNDALPFGSIVPALAALAIAGRPPARPDSPPAPAFRTTLAVVNATFDAAELAARGLSDSAGATRVSGRLPPDVIQKVVRGRFYEYRRCYARLLAKDPTARGRVPMRFVIDRSGDVSKVEISDNTDMEIEGFDRAPTPPTAPALRDPQLERCLIAAFTKLQFPPPEGGIVTVVYPLALAPE